MNAFSKYPEERPGRRSGCLRRRYPSPGKKISISRAADSALSEPWMRFSVSSTARSPRIVPGGASAGLVGPISVRTIFQVSARAGDDHDHGRAPADELDEVAVEGLAGVLGVVPARRLGIDRAQLSRHDAKALSLESADDLADQTPFHGIGLADDQGALHGRGP